MSRFQIYGETDVGQVRENNQDSIDWYLNSEEDVALAVVADGVGGYAGGEVASRLAVEYIRENITIAIRSDISGWEKERSKMAWQMLDAISIANKAILDVSQRNRELAKMGTTLVAALAQADKLCLAHIGDSRAYIYRNESLEQLTHDHSIAQELYDGGSLSGTISAPYRNILTRTLGVAEDVDPDVLLYDTCTDDIFLLCSDGLTNRLDDNDILNILSERESLPQCVNTLVAKANAAGGNDNISAMLIARIE